MNAISEICTLLATIALGLTAGALLAEALVLVPFWRSVPPTSFLSWYKINARRLYNFFAPLEVSTAALTVSAAILHGLTASTGNGLRYTAAILMVTVLAVFPIYFQRANASFADGSIAVERVAEELCRWGTWHWARTGIAIAAFACALLAR
jgi:hypothetical protein